MDCERWGLIREISGSGLYSFPEAERIRLGKSGYGRQSADLGLEFDADKIWYKAVSEGGSFKGSRKGRAAQRQ